MTLIDVSPVLRTADLNGSVAFYTTILGFRYDNLCQKWGWATLRCGGVVVMLARPNAHEPFEKPRFTGSLYFKTENVDAEWERLHERARVRYPIEDFDYGMRKFAIYDNNGYLLQFGQETRASRWDEPTPYGSMDAA